MQYAFSAHRAVVDVDTDLGLVKVVELDCAQDVGKAMNPQAVVGQIQGGTAQGLGLAIMEEIQVRDGQIRNPSFTDYLIPTILDMPPMRIEVLEYPDPHAPYGLRGVGEPPDDLLRPGGRGRDPRRDRARPVPRPDQARAHNGHRVTLAGAARSGPARRRPLAELPGRLDAMLAEADSTRCSPPPTGRWPRATRESGRPGSRCTPSTCPPTRFGPGLAAQWGGQALAALDEWAPGPAEFAAAMGLPPGLAADVLPRVLAKLAAEPIEDLRIDFEDGYGDRDDADARTRTRPRGRARAGRRCCAPDAAPPFTGLRCKSLERRHPPAGDPHAGHVPGASCSARGRCRPGSWSRCRRSPRRPRSPRWRVLCDRLEEAHGLAPGGAAVRDPGGDPAGDPRRGRHRDRSPAACTRRQAA